MRKALLVLSLMLGLVLVTTWVVHHTNSSWDGVDKTVVEKYARAAGRPPREPFINTDQGDLLLFAFLLAGVGGGFVAGYQFRELFPPRKESERA